MSQCHSTLNERDGGTRQVKCLRKTVASTRLRQGGCDEFSCVFRRFQVNNEMQRKSKSNGWVTQVRLKRVKTLCRYLLLEKLGFVEHCLLYIFLFGCV